MLALDEEIDVLEDGERCTLKDVTGERSPSPMV